MVHQMAFQKRVFWDHLPNESYCAPGLRVAFAAVQDSHIVLQLGVLADFGNRMTCGAIEVPPMCAAS